MTETTLTLKAITPSDRSALILEPVMKDSIAAHPALTTVYQTGSVEMRIPRMGEDALASWTPEGEEIATSSVNIDEMVVTPAKAAALVPVSRELAEDSNPAAAEIIGRSLSRALVDQLDQAFAGDLPSPAPSGLGDVNGHMGITSDLQNLDVLHQAKSDIGLSGGKATGLLCSPADALRLVTLKDSADSNRALLEGLETVAGLTVVQSQHIEAGEMWVIDSEAIATVFREDVEVESSRDAYFTSDRVAIRGTLRCGFAFVAPHRLVKITLNDDNGDD